MNQDKLISVIIPTFNRVSLISQTLNTLLSQTYKKWEAIIVDDGSTNKTLDLIREYCQNDERFLLFQRDNEPKGASTCRNIGLLKSHGDYIIFLDSDDILFSWALEQRSNFLAKNDKIDYCVSKGIRGPYPFHQQHEYFLISCYNDKNIAREFFSFYPPWLPLAPTYRKKSLIKNKIKWTEGLEGHQDIDFHIKVANNYLNFEYLNGKPDCLWNVHEHGNIGANFKSKNKFHLIQKIEILKNFESQIKTNYNDITPLLGILIRSYLFSRNYNEIGKEALNILTKNIFLGGLKKQLYIIYHKLFKKNIRFATSFVRVLLILLGESKILQIHPNSHFLIKRYSYVEILNLLEIE